MKHFFLSLVAFSISICSLLGQVNTKVILDRQTESKFQGFGNNPLPNTIRLNIPIDTALIRGQDEDDARNGLPFRFGIGLNTDYSITKDGNLTELSDGKVWQLRFESPKAVSLNFAFDDFELAEGAKLIIYNSEKTIQIGPITSDQNNPNNFYATDLIQGESVVIELFEPSIVKKPSRLHISRVVHAYKNLVVSSVGGFGQSSACIPNVVCDGNYATESNAVAMIILSNQDRICTGSLLNNSCKNLSPNFLTAFHCLDGNSNTWSFRFGYKSTTCPVGSDDFVYKLFSGSTLLSSWQTSDFALLQINGGNPIAGPDISYLGWNNSTTAATTGAIIHHPMGDVMKLTKSTIYAPFSAVSSAIDGHPLVDNSHWGINWTSGATMGGSSGGPLLNQNRLVVGQLHGGNTFCTPANSGVDHFGKFDKSWTGGGTNSTRLSNWLGTGSTSVNTIASPYVSGADLICTTGNFSVSNSLGAVSWSSSYPSGLSINGSGVATRVGGFSGDVTLTATMTLAGGCGTTAVKKIIHVGNPTIVGAGQYQFDACTYQTYISTQSGSNPTWAVVSGSVSLGSTTGYAIYATSTTGGVISVTVSNACGNSSMQFTIPGCGAKLNVYPNPTSSELTLEFPEVDVVNDLPEMADLYQEASTVPVLSINLRNAILENANRPGNIIKVDVSKLPRGVYYLHTKNDINGKTTIEKIRILLN